MEAILARALTPTRLAPPSNRTPPGGSVELAYALAG